MLMVALEFIHSSCITAQVLTVSVGSVFILSSTDTLARHYCGQSAIKKSFHKHHNCQACPGVVLVRNMPKN